MTIRFDRPVSTAARISRQLARFAFALFAVVLVAHRLGLMMTPYFVALVLLSAALSALAVPMALIGLARLWQVGAEGGLAAAKALLYALAPLLLVCFAVAQYFVHPPLYDISTDLLDAPPFLVAPQADQLWLPRNPVITRQDRAVQAQAYPGLSGRRYEGAIDRVYQAVAKVAAQQRITLVKAEGLANTEADIGDLPVKPPADDAAVADALDNVPVPMPRPEAGVDEPLVGRASDVLLQGEIRTLALGLRFDTVIRLREEAETTFVDMRVAARFGPHDLGMGAGLADQYLRALDVELLGIAGN